MKKKIAIVGGILLTILVVYVIVINTKPSNSTDSSTSTVTSAEKKDDYSNFKEYKDEDFTYKIPSSWSKSIQGDTTYYYRNDDDSMDGMIMIYKTELDESIMEPGSFDSYVEGFEESEEYLGETKKRDITIDGIDAKQMSAKTKIQGEESYIVSSVFDYDEGIVTFGFLTREKDQYADEYNAILESIDIIDNTSETTTEKSTTESTTEKVTTEKTTQKDTTPTTGEINALNSAYDYLDYSAFSRSGLIEQLEYEGYTNDEATYAADNCGADWNEQAVKSAQEYLDYGSFSKIRLIEQLEHEGFTKAQATYGVNQVY